MTWGALCPLPLRLRADRYDGWYAGQQSRLCADQLAQRRTQPFAWLTYSTDGSAVSSVEYTGEHNIGGLNAPTSTVLGTGAVQWDWAAQYTNDHDHSTPTFIRHVKASVHGSAAAVAVAEINNPRRVTVRTFNATTGAALNARVTLKVGTTRDADIGDYGGDTEKRETTTEDIPYAWAWYQHYEDSLGSSFTRNRTGDVHARKLALARGNMMLDRLWERFRNNLFPGTSDEMLGKWLKTLGVVVHEKDRPWKLRQQAAAIFAMSVGPTQATIDQAIADLMGGSLQQIIRPRGADLATPPDQTFWPGVNPGSPTYDLGGGAWISERAHVAIIVDKPAASDQQNFLFQVNVRLQNLADRIFPAECTFSWSTSSDGFYLDFSELDFDGLIPGGEGTFHPSLGSAPSVINQPDSVDVPIGLTQLNAAAFSVTATSAESYQWQVDTGGGFADIDGMESEFTAVDFDTDTLSLTDIAAFDGNGEVTSDANGFEFRCVVTNMAGSATSDAATLTTHRATIAEIIGASGATISYWEAEQEVYEDTSDPAENGDGVVEWQDLGAAGYHLTQTGGDSLEPIYETNVVNSTLPGLQFGAAGAPRLVNSGAVVASGDWYVICAYDYVGTVGVVDYLWYNNSDNHGLFSGGSAVPTGSADQAGWRSPAGTVHQVPSDTNAAGPAVLECGFVGTTLTVSHNGWTNLHTETISGAPHQLRNLSVGARPSDGSRTNCELNTMAIYSGNDSDVKLDLRWYCAGKIGATLS